MHPTCTPATRHSYLDNQGRLPASSGIPSSPFLARTRGHLLKKIPPYYNWPNASPRLTFPSSPWGPALLTPWSPTSCLPSPSSICTGHPLSPTHQICTCPRTLAPIVLLAWSTPSPECHSVQVVSSTVSSQRGISKDANEALPLPPPTTVSLPPDLIL